MTAARRLQRKSSSGGARQLKAAVEQVRTAMGSLGAVGDLSKTIQELGQQTERVARLSEALTEDYESLASELELQREVILELCIAGSAHPADYWRDKETEIRTRLLERKATT